jgi:hypothetical protein
MTKRAVVRVLVLLCALAPAHARAQSTDAILDPPEPRVGDVARLTISLTGGARTGSATFAGKKVPGFETGGLLNMYFGVDLGVKPGTYEIEYEMPGIKQTVKGTVPIVIAPGEFATATVEGEPECEEAPTGLDQESRERAQREAREIETIWSQASPQRLWTKAFVPPAVGAPGAPFGLQRVFPDGRKIPHSGIDIEAPEGTEVYASNGGKVVLANELLLGGNTVIIDHGLGLYTVYAHLSRIDVDTGEDVVRAKVIGLVGKTGCVDGSHLHWSARIVGARVDPTTLPGMSR